MGRNTGLHLEPELYKCGCTQERIILIIKELLKINACLKHSVYQDKLSFIPYGNATCMIIIGSTATEPPDTTAIGFSPTCQIVKPHLEVSSPLKFAIQQL